MVQFALIWYLTVLTGSATVLASASIISLLPNVILGPFVGTLVDRWNRRVIMLMADSIITLATIILAVLFLGEAVALWHIYIVMFVRVLAGSFHSNAMRASTSLMVPREQLTRVQGMNQILDGGLNIVAAPLGAFLLSILPMQGILAIDATTALFAVFPLLLIQIPEPERLTGNVEKVTIWQDFKAGLRYVLAWRGLFIVSLLTVGINFTVIPAFSLLPLLVKEYFGGNAVHLDWVEAALGTGIIFGGVILGIWGGFNRNIMTPIAMGPFYAMIQATVAPDMQARTFSLLTSVGSAMVPLGLMFAGPITDLAGIQVWFLFGGETCVLMAIVEICIPDVRNIERQGEYEHMTLANAT